MQIYRLLEGSKIKIGNVEITIKEKIQFQTDVDILNELSINGNKTEIMINGEWKKINELRITKNNSQLLAINNYLTSSNKEDVSKQKDIVLSYINHHLLSNV